MTRAFNKKLSLVLLALAAAVASRAADYPAPAEDDYVIRDFHFKSGQTLPELRLHYRTLGSPRRDDMGVVSNAVLILHGTTGNGAQFLQAQFAGKLFGPGPAARCIEIFE
jgi:homoserine O-acetyltransferase/O-succinyltransferase